jgi:Polysaccharide deacetylase
VKAAAVVVAPGVIALAQTPPTREVAVTFDDLPVAGVTPRDASARRTLTANLLRAITAHHVPVVAFVNEIKLAGQDRPDVRVLEMWLDAGLELGNHPPDAETADMRSYCPRCHAQYAKSSGDCADCLDVGLEPLSARPI